MQLHFPFSQSQKGGGVEIRSLFVCVYQIPKVEWHEQVSSWCQAADRVVDSWLAVLESDQMYIAARNIENSS